MCTSTCVLCDYTISASGGRSYWGWRADNFPTLHNDSIWNSFFLLLFKFFLEIIITTLLITGLWNTGRTWTRIYFVLMTAMTAYSLSIFYAPCSLLLFYNSKLDIFQEKFWINKELNKVLSSFTGQFWPSWYSTITKVIWIFPSTQL